MTLVDAAGDAGTVRPWLHPSRVPAFHLDLRTDQLAWTDANNRLYGYAPGEVSPSLELVYAHRPPDDRSRMRRLVRRAIDDGTGFVFAHRMLTRAGRPLPVVSVVDVVTDESTVLDVTGVTQPLGEKPVPELAAATTADPDAVVSALVAEIAQLRDGLVHRDVIGMAKGIVMAQAKVTSEQAFARLVTASQRSNTKLREVAQVVVDTGALPD